MTEQSTTAQTVVNGRRLEFKEAMDALISKCGELLIKSQEVDKAFEKWESDALNDKEMAYYLEVNNRVLKKISEIY